jgi:hypothetical protein
MSDVACNSRVAHHHHRLRSLKTLVTEPSNNLKEVFLGGVPEVIDIKVNLWGYLFHRGVAFRIFLLLFRLKVSVSDDLSYDFANWASGTNMGRAYATTNVVTMKNRKVSVSFVRATHRTEEVIGVPIQSLNNLVVLKPSNSITLSV